MVINVLSLLLLIGAKFKCHNLKVNLQNKLLDVDKNYRFKYII